MKLRILIATALIMALAVPVVASSGAFSDVNAKHAEAVAFVTAEGRNLLPPDSRAGTGEYGARYGVRNEELTRAIKLYFRDDNYLRREEAASFLHAGIKRVNELRAQQGTSTPTEPRAGTTGSLSSSSDRVQRVTIPAGTYRFTSSCRGWGDVTLKGLNGASPYYERLADCWGDAETDITSVSISGGSYVIEINKNGTVRWEPI